MKRHFIMSMAFLVGVLLTASISFAQQKSDYKARNYKLRSINAQGEVLDEYGTKLGYISKEDIVYNSEGKKLGFIENGKVYDAEGKPLGKAKKNGSYYNNQGENVVTVKGNAEICEILDPEGHKMGTVHKNYKLHSCAVHCFFLEQEKEKKEQ